MEQTLKNILRRIEKTPDKLGLYEDCFECIKLLKEEDKEIAYKYNAIFRKYIKKALRIFKEIADLQKLDFLQKESYHLEAVDKFDSFLIFVEWNREPLKRFYLPRRKVLKILVDDLQDLADHVITFLGISVRGTTLKF